MVQGRYVQGDEDLSVCFALREGVFLDELKKKREEVFDSKDEYALHVLVYFEGAPAGTGRITFDTLQVVRVSQLCVAKDLRKKGVGDLLLRLLLVRALDAHCEKVCVTACPSSAPFFARYGFQRVGEEGEDIHMALAYDEIEKLFSTCAGCKKCGAGCAHKMDAEKEKTI
ncbi:MAG: GNAT family N-acetyltransferase [Christensenellales bacterium]|jgi:predicted GNAT family N-acyltransferase